MSRANLEMLCLTWNVNEQRPEGSPLFNWIADLSGKASIAVVALQEIEMGSSSVAIAAAKDVLNKSAQVRPSPPSQTCNPPCTCVWLWQPLLMVPLKHDPSSLAGGTSSSALYWRVLLIGASWACRRRATTTRSGGRARCSTAWGQSAGCGWAYASCQACWSWCLPCPPSRYASFWPLPLLAPQPRCCQLPAESDLLVQFICASPLPQYTPPDPSYSFLCSNYPPPPPPLPFPPCWHPSSADPFPSCRCRCAIVMQH